MKCSAQTNISGENMNLLTQTIQKLGMWSVPVMSLHFLQVTSTKNPPEYYSDLPPLLGSCPAPSVSIGLLRYEQAADFSFSWRCSKGVSVYQKMGKDDIQLQVDSSIKKKNKFVTIAPMISNRKWFNIKFFLSSAATLHAVSHTRDYYYKKLARISQTFFQLSTSSLPHCISYSTPVFSVMGRLPLYSTPMTLLRHHQWNGHLN